MLPKPNRLRARKDFETLWKKSRSVYGRVLGVRFAPNGQIESRVGIVIGVKISKRSTKRNAVKRKIREILRKKVIEIMPGFDIAIVARQGVLEVTFDDLQKEINLILAKAGLLKK